MIKYKGNTSKILIDISFEFGNIVDLKSSEIILKGFFEEILREISVEKQIEILSILPVFIKPFYQKSKGASVEHTLFHTHKNQFATEKIFKVLQKHIALDAYLSICSCKLRLDKNEVFLAA